MAKMEIEALVEGFVLEIIRDTALELVDVEYVKERDWYLRIFLDKEGGLEIEDCQAVSSALEDKLDAADPITDSYYLEVSSPGLDRALKKERDFVRHAGSMVEMNTFAPIEGRKQWIGKLHGLEAGNIVLDVDGETIRIPREKVSLIRLHLEF
ncbi:ribosome maturation factor RimP [Azotosporobacter soli]|uniref:ribosome maturation factor RimP n=1 Tax=Azotosporobacter soli TaxID=3055040 RepID=UPI0031FE8104